MTTGKYNDIIHLPRHVSKKHPPMPIIDRAAQFAPFAALTGHDAAIKETARLTDKRKELDEYEKDALNERLRLVAEQIDERPEIKITYFQPDDKKEGGAYVSVVGCVKKIDHYERMVCLEDGIKIPMEEIFEIDVKLAK